MKRSTLALLSILMTFATFAQLDIKPAVGYNLARFDSKPVFMDGTDTLSTSSNSGYQVGAYVSIGRKMYIEPGIFYCRLSQGFTPQDIEKQEFTYNANFLRIPVNLGFLFIGHPNSFAGVRVFIGPSLLVPLSVKDNTYPINSKDVKSPQVDFSVGAGLNIWRLFLDFSYGWGLTPQFKDDPITAKMQAMYLNIGYRFKLKHED